MPRQSYPKTTPRPVPKPDRLKIEADRERARRELLRPERKEKRPKKGTETD